MGGSVLNAAKRKSVFKNNRVTDASPSKRVASGKIEKLIRSSSFDKKNTSQEISGKLKATVVGNRTVYKRSSCAVLIGIQMVLFLVILNYFIDSIEGSEVGNTRSRHDKSMQWREPKKMFGGYRITPRFCTPSRPSRRHKADERRGPAICMFNHECAQRDGEVVGACMDGFLFGACCQLFGTPGVMKDTVESGVVMMVSNDAAIKKPEGLLTPTHINEENEGDIVKDDKYNVPAVGNVIGGSNMYLIRTTERETNAFSKSPDDETNEQVMDVNQDYVKKPSTLAVSLTQLDSSTEKYHDLTSGDLAQIANSLLNEGLDTADILPENIDTLSAGLFSHSTISHEEADTILLDKNGSVIMDISRPSDFINPGESVQVSTMQTKPSMATQFYSKIPSTTPSTTIFTHKPIYQKPAFRPRPRPTKQPVTAQDKYVLVQTVNKPLNSEQNKPQTSVTASDTIPEMASIESIMNMLNETHPSTITYERSTSIVTESPEVKYTTVELIDRTSSSPLQYSSGYPIGYDTYESTSQNYPTSGHYITTGSNKYTTYKPPSTSYVYSPTVTRRPGYASSTDKFTNNYGSTSSYFTKRPIHIKDSTDEDVESSTNSNTISSTLSYDDYWGSSQETFSSTSANRKPPSTSYVYSATPTKRPLSNVHNVVGPTYDVLSGSPDTFSSVTPTVIVLSSLDSQNYNSQTPKPIKYPVRQPVEAEDNFIEVPLEPPHKKPVHLVTINNVISSTNNIHLGQHSPQVTSSEKPAPTVLITPKPSALSSPGASYYSTRPGSNDYNNLDKTTVSPFTTNKAPSTSYVFSSTVSKRPTTSATPTNIQSSHRPSKPRPKPTIAPYDPDTTIKIDFHTSPDEFINFPPVRNPNLNATGSNPAAFNSSVTLDTIGDTILQEVEFTTPAFLQEDEDLDDKMSLFVNKIVGSLQGTFQELHDIVILDKTPNTTITQQGGNKVKPVGDTTTKKPITVTTKKPGGNTTKKPVKPSTTTTKKPVRASTTTKKPVSPNAVSTVTTTKKPTRATTTTKKPRPTRPKTTTPVTTIATEAAIIEEDAYTTETPSGDFKHLCGVRPMVKSGRIVGGKGASFGSWPWQVLVRESTWLGLFTKNKCGGVLITNRYVTTAAHCQPGFLASLVAVFGEFDISGELESKRSVTKNVRRVIVHRQYDAATFENDLALLELDSPVTYDTHIVPICMPSDAAEFRGRVATVTGWGRLKYGGGVPSVLQEVQVPVIENSVCQEMFQTAGHSKVILNSFLCAGYANGQKDSCEGDSGGPLTLQRPDGRWELVGTVSHGIKCAAPYLPGVYMRTTFYKPWLKSITGVH